MFPFQIHKTFYALNFFVGNNNFEFVFYFERTFHHLYVILKIVNASQRPLQSNSSKLPFQKVNVLFLYIYKKSFSSITLYKIISICKQCDYMSLKQGFLKKKHR